MPAPRFVWIDDHGTGRNVFALFRRRFRLASVPKRAALNLFADTRYRLRVNGAVASYGPARFVPGAPEHDVVDLAPHLRRGWNVLVVEANHKGASSFDSLPSIGGFIAWGKAGAVDLATPGDWRAMPGLAWDADAPPFSFAQSPLEICDLRLLPEGLDDPAVGERGWGAPATLREQGHWGRLAPRSIPALSLHERLPESVPLVARIAGGELRVGFRVEGAPSGGGKRRRVPYALCIHAPQEMTVTAGMFWGPHWLNGEELACRNHAQLGNRQDADLRLRAGWNLLYGEPEVMTESWLVLIGLPADRGLTVASEPRLDAPAAMLGGPSVAEDALLAARGGRVPAAHDQLPDLPWRAIPRDGALTVPAREMAWDVPEGAAPRAAGDRGPITLDCAPGRAATAVLDLGGEFLGHVVVEADGPAGTQLDIACAERRRADGCLAFFATHWMVSEAERFTLAGGGGGERVEAFHPRGGRWVQITARADAPVTLRRVAVRETVYPLAVEGRFACGDRTFERIWTMGIDTLRACMEDSYLDCPWRERGLYVGDALTEWHATRSVTSDWALQRRCLRLWAQGQRPDGQMQDVVPSWHETALEDYSLIWVIVLHEWWRHTGDVALVREVWPSVAKLFASPAWRFGDTGLLDASGMHIFIDAFERREAKQAENACLNAYWAHALACAAELGALVGKRSEAARYAAQARTARTAFAQLWDADAKRFAGARVKGELLAGPAPQANALAVCYGLASRAQVGPALDALEADLEANPSARRINAFFLHFALDALYRDGRAAAAERAMRLNYAPMIAAGAWTIWEHLDGHGSLCHAWSAAPLRIFSERVLGVRPAKDAVPDQVVIAPHAETLDWAEGVVPHRRGPIAVAWEVQGDALLLRVRAPAGVRWTARPEGRLAGLRLVLDR